MTKGMEGEPLSKPEDPEMVSSSAPTPSGTSRAPPAHNARQFLPLTVEPLPPAAVVAPTPTFTLCPCLDHGFCVGGHASGGAGNTSSLPGDHGSTRPVLSTRMIQYRAWSTPFTEYGTLNDGAETPIMHWVYPDLETGIELRVLRSQPASNTIQPVDVRYSVHAVLAHDAGARARLGVVGAVSTSEQGRKGQQSADEDTAATSSAEVAGPSEKNTEGAEA